MFKWLYQFIFIDQNTKCLSHSKFWSHIGYGIMCWSFVHVIIDGKTEIDYMLWVLFGIVVIGNRTLTKIMVKENK